MNPDLSIIIPVYNCEKYLYFCLESIRGQTFENFECILIDDGSKDLSGSICDDFVAKDSRFKVIHQQNQGASVARNSGINCATGTWLGFVDSDDWIDKQTYEIVIKTAIEKNVDQVQWGISLEDNGKIILTKTFEDGYFNVSEKKDYFEPSMCHKIVKREIVETNNIRFPEGKTLSEDKYFAFLCYINSKKDYAIPQTFYHYRMNPASASHNMSEKNIQDEIQVLTSLESYINSREDSERWNTLLFNEKLVAKNHCILLLKKPNCNLWRNVFPEMNKKLFKINTAKGFVYKLLLLKFDFFVKLIIKFVK